MPRDWAAAVAQLTDVQKLAHLAMRQTADDEKRIASDLLRVRRQAYENELTQQAGRVGCPGRRGNLGNNPSLKELADKSAEEAKGIVNTYNYDLAAQIRAIGQEVRSANRNTYAKRLLEWDGKHKELKTPVIEQYAENSARSQAQIDFYQFNAAIMGKAWLEPKEAECPVCQGLIERGEIPLREAELNPPPYHPRCPHRYMTKPEEVAKDECPLLWMGA